MDFDGFWWILMGFEGFWWVLVDFDGFWWILMSFDEFWWILMGFDGFRGILMGFEGFWGILMGFDWFWWVKLRYFSTQYRYFSQIFNQCVAQFPVFIERCFDTQQCDGVGTLVFYWKIATSARSLLLPQWLENGSRLTWLLIACSRHTIKRNIINDVLPMKMSQSQDIWKHSAVKYSLI